MKHIILIGFKHSGKSAVGKKLAERIGREFLDLDTRIEELYAKTSGSKISAREIMQKEGVEYFRELEDRAFDELVKHVEPAVIAVGGGTPMAEKNRNRMKEHLVIYVSAPAGILYERIMVNGKPAFFPKDMSPFDGFKKILAERLPVFESLAAIKVENDSSVDVSVGRIADSLSEKALLLI